MAITNINDPTFPLSKREIMARDITTLDGVSRVTKMNGAALMAAQLEERSSVTSISFGRCRLD